jgi:hypothetical protein
VIAATVVRTKAPRQPGCEGQRYELGYRHGGQDHGELTAPGRDGEPEDGEEEEASEAGCGSACGVAEERGERDVAERDPDGRNPGDERPAQCQPDQDDTKGSRDDDLAVVEPAGRKEEQHVSSADCDQRERDRVLRRLGSRSCVAARPLEAGCELGG